METPIPLTAHPTFPAWLAWLILLGVCVITGGSIWWLRKSASRVWQQFAAEVKGEYRAKNSLSPACVVGDFGTRPFILETALSHDDDAPYYHTRGAIPTKNRAGIVLGLRRKSLLEEAQTRKVEAEFDLHDSDFTRRFFIVCTAPEHLEEILTTEVRRELSRYNDIELYIRFEELEWRRGGEVSDLNSIRRLMTLIGGIASTLDTMPSRSLTLSRRLADEALIAKGV